MEHTSTSLAAFYSVVRRLLLYLQPVLENRCSTSCDTLELLSTRLEVLHRQLNRYSSHCLRPGHPVHNIVSELGKSVQTFYEMLSTLPSSAYQATIVRNGPGIPRYDIPQNQLLHLVGNGFTCPQISQMLGVSLRTIHRRMDEYGINSTGTYSTLNDSELDTLIQEIQILFPNCGYAMMAGHLLSRGQRVQQMRIRESMIRLYPDGVATRWFTSIQRRSYQVYGPMALRHLDGMHKLMRQKFLKLYACTMYYHEGFIVFNIVLKALSEASGTEWFPYT